MASWLVWSAVCITAAQGVALVTPPPMLPRQAVGADFIGYTQTGTIFRYIGCGAAKWSTTANYGNCCDPAYPDCDLAISCTSGTIIYPSGVKQDCGPTNKYCDVGLVGESYDPLASTNPTPSISIFWCRSDSAPPWTVWRTVANAVTFGSGTHPVLVVSTQSKSGATGAPGAGAGSSAGGSSTAPSDPNSTGESKFGSLGVGGLIGVVISGVCSVLGLLFGIGFKIWKHRKQQKKEQLQQQGSGETAAGKEKDKADSCSLPGK